MARVWVDEVVDIRQQHLDVLCVMGWKRTP